MSKIFLFLFMSLLLFNLTFAQSKNSSPILSKEQHFLSTEQTYNSTCPLWFKKDPLQSDGLCFPLRHMTCDDNHFSLLFGTCATYSEDDDLLSMYHCPFFRATKGYNVTTSGYLLLPNDIYKLNDNICGPLKRKGVLCSECVDGYGPAVNSFKDECSNCKGVWYGVPLYFVTELLPLTLFYLIITIFQVNITSAPMTCFIMYSQMILMIFSNEFDGHAIKELIYTDRNYPSSFMKIVFTIYGIWNLDFFRYVIPPFCVSSKLKSIHIALLGYISAFYPLCLIAITWICIELHDRNFKPFVVIWKPFQLCRVKLRRNWNNKGDIISVFASFFLLSYSKLGYQVLLLTNCKTLSSTKYHSCTCNTSTGYLSLADPRISCGNSEYFTYAIPALVITLLFNILPAVVIFLYPIPQFRRLLSKLRLDCSALRFFVERFQGCYKDVAHDGNGRDMRSFSALYFFLRIVAVIAVLLFEPFTSPKHSHLLWFPIGTMFVISAILIALFKPYRKTYINTMDTLLLTHFGLLCYLMFIAGRIGAKRKQVMLWVVIKLLLLFPFATFVLWIIAMAAIKMKITTSIRNYFKQNWCKTHTVHTECEAQKAERAIRDVCDSESNQPPISPTTITINTSSYYGSM